MTNKTLSDFVKLAAEVIEEQGFIARGPIHGEVKTYLRDNYQEDHKKFLADFIPYLQGTEDHEWCVDVVRSIDLKANCLFGHLSNFCGHTGNDIVSDDFDWFESLVTTTYVVYPVNDGQNKSYPQLTPKARCIALMQAILDGEELTTREGMALEALLWDQQNDK